MYKNAIYENILILNLRKIGDTVMATAAAYLLKRAYPKAKITMLVKPLTRSIVENNSVIDEVLLYDYSHKAKYKDIKKAAHKLKEKQYNLAVIIDNKPRSALLAWLADIPIRVGFEKITLRNIYLRLLYTKIYKIDYDFMATQQVHNHEIFINKLTGRNDKAKMIMPVINAENKEKVDKLLANLAPKKIKIALCIRSGVVFKDWPRKYFAAVVSTLAQKYAAGFYIVGGANDVNYADEFGKMLSDIEMVNLCGQTTLPELGYLLSKADLLLSVDTGTAHIAAAVDTPEIVIFAGTSHQHWAPYGDKVYPVYPKIDCYPCSDRVRKECKGYPCLDAVAIDDVQKACRKTLDQLIEG